MASSLRLRKVHTSRTFAPLADENPQLSCPLFDGLPPEIRFYIYKYAVAATYSPEHPDLQAERQWPWRLKPIGENLDPSEKSFRHISTTLLLVCRRIYNEAALLPVSTNEHFISYLPSDPGCLLKWCTREHISYV